MKVGMYSVFDRKASLFNQPFFAVNDVMASRTVFMREKLEPGQLSEFPEDFMLTKVGEFDHVTGHVSDLDHKFEIVDEIRNILRGKEINL